MTSTTMLLADTADRPRRAGAKRSKRGGADGPASASSSTCDAEHLPHAVIIDCTASDEVAGTTPTGSRRGIHVITPNKQAEQRGPRATTATLARGAPRRRLALPLRGDGRRRAADHPDLARSARDRRRDRRIEGIFSGTLAYLFNVWDGSAAVLGARARRKGQRLHRARSARRSVGHWTWRASWSSSAREMGMPLELDDVAARKPGARVAGELLAPKSSWSDCPSSTPDVEAARGRARRGPSAALRRLARRGNARATVGLVELEPSHPFANISLTDNIVRFTTEPLRPQSARRAGSGRRPGRSRRPACSPICCECAPTSGRACDMAGTRERPA